VQQFLHVQHQVVHAFLVQLDVLLHRPFLDLAGYVLEVVFEDCELSFDLVD
jgi:hypothetical protein